MYLNQSRLRKVFILEKITYNSWSNNYKTPFGALKVDSQVVFTINCQLPAIHAVYLMIHKDFGQSFQIEMEAVKEGNYQTTFELSEGSGLYFYYFKIDYPLNNHVETLYYGNNRYQLGGLGETYYEIEDIKQYQLTSYLYDDPAPEWYRSGVAYQIFVDRFYNGNEKGIVSHPKKNSFIYASPEDDPVYLKDEIGDIMRWEFFGGNLKGIIQKLPYLANLGITILYLNPIFEARSNHKYDTGDFLKIDPMFGDEAIFKELIEQARTLGIHIILDGVFNHTGADSRYFNRYGTYDDLGAYQSRESEYADWYTFDQFPEEYQSWWGIKDVPTLNKETPAVQNFIYAGKDSVIRTWSKLGLGGWRIDVADELSDSFLAGIRKALEETIAEPVLIGEVWEDASNKIAYEQRRHYLEGGMLHGAMNYPFREIIIGVLNHTITTKEAALRSMHLKENYPPEAFKNNFNNIGTHDTARILTAVQNNVPALKQALALLFALPGIPCLYYGDEAGVEGGEDPANRKMFPWGRENKTIQSYAYEWIALRREEAALQEGDYYAFSTRKVLGIVRYLSEEEYLVLLINVSDQEVTFTTKETTADYSFDIQAFLTKQGLAEKTIPAQGIQVIKKSR